MLDLHDSAELLRLLGDSTRVRLLSVLSGDELTVAELTRVTRLPQSRVSTHLGRLREAGLVRDRRSGASSFYALNEAGMTDDCRRLWAALRESTDDAVLRDPGRRRCAACSGWCGWATFSTSPRATGRSPSCWRRAPAR